MNPSPITIGVVMALLGVLVPTLGRHQQGFSIDAVTIVAAVWLVVGGVALMLRRSIAFWIALGAGLFVAVAGAWGLVEHRMVGLPFQPAVSTVAGLYMCFRVAMARAALGPRAPRHSIVEQLDLDDK